MIILFKSKSFRFEIKYEIKSGRFAIGEKALPTRILSAIRALISKLPSNTSIAEVNTIKAIVTNRKKEFKFCFFESS